MVKNKDKFEFIYEVEDGFVRGPVLSALQSFFIYFDELGDDAKEDDIDKMIDDYMQRDFKKNIYPKASNKEIFIKWALAKIKEKKND
jgi:hypothetical protein